MPPTTQPTLHDITLDRWDSLPPELKHALLRNDFDKNIHAVSSYYKLDEKVTQTLVNEVMLVLFLFEPLSKLADALRVSAPSISAENAVAIVSELKLTVFYGVTDILTAIETSKEFTSLRTTHTTPTPPVPDPPLPVPPPPKVTTPQIPEAPKDLREKLELRPEEILTQTVTASEGGVRPLTREEVLRSLAPARTMASDIASLSTKQGSLPTPPQQ